jgi:hypothetical protein
VTCLQGYKTERLGILVYRDCSYYIFKVRGSAKQQTYIAYTVRSESHCALRLRYGHLVVSIGVAVEVSCCCVPFHCIQLSNSG